MSFHFLIRMNPHKNILTVIITAWADQSVPTLELSKILKIIMMTFIKSHLTITLLIFGLLRPLNNHFTLKCGNCDEDGTTTV